MISFARSDRSVGDHGGVAPRRPDPFGDPPRQFTSWRSAVASMCILALAVVLCVLTLVAPFAQ